MSGVRGTMPTIGPAFASDASPPLVTKTSPIAWTGTAARLLFSWTGFYFGLNGELLRRQQLDRWRDRQLDRKFQHVRFCFRRNSGRDCQVGQLVFGVEADDPADASGFGTFRLPLYVRRMPDDKQLAQHRASRPRWLRARSIPCVPAPAVPPLAMCGRISLSDSVSGTTEAGWTAGAGVEVALARNWSAKARLFRRACRRGHAPLIALSQMQAEHLSFPTSPSNSARAWSAAASITDLPGSRSGLPFGEARSGLTEGNLSCAS